MSQWFYSAEYFPQRVTVRHGACFTAAIIMVRSAIFFQRVLHELNERI